jgi:hypothetical protein
MAAQEDDKAVRGRDIGAHGMRRTPSVMLQMALPPRGQLARRMI